MVNDPFGGSMIPFGGLMDGQSLCDETSLWMSKQLGADAVSLKHFNT